MYFLAAGGKFGLGTPVHDVNLGTKPEGGTCGIHCHIAATHDAHLLTGVDRSKIILPPGLHKVVAGKELVG